MSDELGRVDIGDFVANRKERLFHVGRLDADTEGLLILTNDGDLAHRLQHPRYGVPKTYLAQIAGPVPRDLGAGCARASSSRTARSRSTRSSVVDSAPGKALVEVVLHEGRKHIVRRMLAEVGHPVVTLVRMQVGPDPPGRHQARQVAQPHEHGGRGPLHRGGAVTRVHVIGTGLLGTSLGLALRRLGDDVTLEDISPTHAALARDLGAGRLPAGPVDPELVVVATPPDVTADVVADALRAGPRQPSPTSPRSRAPCRRPAPAGTDLTRYCGSHPMAGRERSGAVSGRHDLFDGRRLGAHAHGGDRPRGHRARHGARPVGRRRGEHARPRSTTTRRSRPSRTCPSWRPAWSPPGSRRSTRPPSRSPARACATSPASRRAIPACGPRSSPGTPPPSARCSPRWSDDLGGSSTPSTR